MDILIKASQLLLSLSLLIVLHELGHFIPARIFKTRVEKFYLFFDWKFSLFKIKRGDTEYGIGWIPLGGYVKISGMIDESMDKEQMAKPAEPWEFRAKPAWQRLIIMLGGVTVNLILGFLIYAMILFVWGRERLPLASAVYGMHTDSLMLAHGFREGDKILKIGDLKPYDSQDFVNSMILDDHKNATVERYGNTVVINFPENFKEILIENTKKGESHFFPRFPPVIEEVDPGKPAAKSALKAGDQITKLNGRENLFAFDISKEIQKNKGEKLQIEARAIDGTIKTVEITPDSKGMIGVKWKSYADILEMDRTEYSFFQSIPAGVVLGVETLTKYVKQIPLLFTKAGAKQLGGFGAIGNMFEPEWDWFSFWQLTAFLSIALAFMNILPIPALDGGHVIFLLWEIVRGKPAPEKVMEYGQYVGMALLLALMLFANGNDVFKAIFN